MKNKKIITLILIFLWMVTVFSLSSQVSEESSKLSGGITDAVIDTFGIDIKSYAHYSHTETIIRKLTHYGLYTIGGLLLFLHINLYTISINKKIILSLLIGITYAITDEMHQIVVSGRSGEIRDISIDSLGIITGITILLLIYKIHTKLKR